MQVDNKIGKIRLINGKYMNSLFEKDINRENKSKMRIKLWMY